MKKQFRKVAAVIVAFLFASAASAQNSQSSSDELLRHEIGVSYGMLTNTDIISSFVSIFGQMFMAVLGNNEKVESHYLGSFNAEYYYNFNKTIGLGGIVGLDYIGYDFNDETTGKTNLKEKDFYFNFMPAFKAHWFNYPHVSMYSKLAVGLTVDYGTFDVKDKNRSGDYSDDTKCLFAFQASPVCIEAGSRHIMGFAELGYGTQGLFTVGLRGKF